MQLFEKDSARLTAEYGITVGRWEQYGVPEGTLPVGAMWSIVPPRRLSAHDPPPADPVGAPGGPNPPPRPAAGVPQHLLDAAGQDRLTPGASRDRVPADRA